MSVKLNKPYKTYRLPMNSAVFSTNAQGTGLYLFLDVNFETDNLVGTMTFEDIIVRCAGQQITLTPTAITITKQADRVRIVISVDANASISNQVLYSVTTRTLTITAT